MISHCMTSAERISKTLNCTFDFNFLSQYFTHTQNYLDSFVLNTVANILHWLYFCLYLPACTILRSPGRDIELYSWHFFISFPQDKKLWPRGSNSLPQVNNSLPQVDNSLPQVKKSFPQVSKLFPQDSKLFPQVRKSFPQDSKSFPQVSKSFPQVRKSFPQDSKSFPQVRNSSPQVRNSFPQDSKIAKCLFYGTFLGPSKIFQHVTLDWVLFWHSIPCSISTGFSYKLCTWMQQNSCLLCCKLHRLFIR